METRITRELYQNQTEAFWLGKTVVILEELRSGFALAMTRLANAPLGLRSFLLRLRPFGLL